MLVRSIAPKGDGEGAVEEGFEDVHQGFFWSYSACSSRLSVSESPPGCAFPQSTRAGGSSTVVRAVSGPAIGPGFFLTFAFFFMPP